MTFIEGLLKQAVSHGGKITRAALIYLEPKKVKKDFAQCSTCPMWTGPKHNTCTIHGRKTTVTGTMSCSFYVEGKPMPDEAGHEMAAVTPEESGLVDRKVRCENCKYGDSKRAMCTLYEQLNEVLPETFDLDVKIKPEACCNAQTPRS